jgi:type IV pilus assembly protein PilQ
LLKPKNHAEYNDWIIDIRRMKNILILSLTLLTAVFVGCASQNTVDSNRNGSKQIVDIIINETPDSLVLSIRGNQKLTHSEDKQVSSKEIIIYFPDTSVDGVRGHFIPPDNDLISYIKTGQYVENETTGSAIYIALKKVSPHDVTPDKDGLQVTFPKIPALSDKIKPQEELAENKPEPRLTQKSVPVATVLRTVTTETLDNTVAVNVKADGTINNYKAFTMVNPARIVFDLYNIKSPYHKEQKITVQSKWVKRIRYFGHPDKLRLVIETHKEYLSKYSSVSTDTSLIIHVGSKN